MMQTSDGPDETANASSPLNKLKQSLRISDDDNIGRNHKRQLSLSQQVVMMLVIPHYRLGLCNL